MSNFNYDPSPESGFPIEGDEFAAQTREEINGINTELTALQTSLQTDISDALALAEEAKQGTDSLNTALETHAADKTAHGATAAAEALSIAARRPDGTFDASDPLTDTNVATKRYVDAQVRSMGMFSGGGSGNTDCRIIYDIEYGGTAVSPETITTDQRAEYPTPYSSVWGTRVEVLLDGKYGDPSYCDGAGVRATAIDDDTIVIQSGPAGVLAESVLSGNGFDNQEPRTELPYRLILWDLLQADKGIPFALTSQEGIVSWRVIEG